jgi:hypothetical protein
MTEGWKCDRCCQLHTQNPSSFRNGGHVIFSALTEQELQRQSGGVDAPEAMEISDDRVMGTAPDDVAKSSPDVALDGSVVNADDSTAHDDADPPSSLFGRLRSILPF